MHAIALYKEIIMRIYVNTDLEGVSGVTSFEQTRNLDRDARRFLEEAVTAGEVKQGVFRESAVLYLFGETR